MKIVHVTYSVNGGAGIAAFRLHSALKKNNISSAFVSTNLTVDFDNETIEDPFFLYKKPSIYKRVINKIKIIFWRNKRMTLEKKVAFFSKNLNFEKISLPFSNFKLHNHPLIKEADIINLHWISGIVDYPTFFRNCKKPIVWTLHDMNPFLGMFHYQNDLKKASIDLLSLNNIVSKYYKKSLEPIKKLQIVTPSLWLKEESLKHELFAKFPHKNIANSINTTEFKLLKKNELKVKYNIETDKFVLLFVSESITNYRKGFDILIQALKSIANMDLTIITIGNGKINLNQNNIKVLEFGRLKELHKLIEIYNLADVFLLPSREDNLPNVILESYACGLPVIGFNIGGVKEHLLNKYTGINAGETNAENLSKAITMIYKDSCNYNSHNINKYAEVNFSFKKQATKYVEVYKSLLN